VSVETLQPPRSLTSQPGAFVPLLRLALPVLAGHLLDMMVGFTDTWLTGNFLATAEHLAAMNLTGYLLWFMVSMFSLVSIGTTAMVARFVGAGDWSAARHTTNQAFVIGLVVCALPVALVVVAGAPFVGVLGLDGAARELTLRYLWIVLPAVPAMMVEQVGNAALRGAGDTITGMVALIVTNVVDIFLSYVLVRGIGPFPEMGWDGLALGTTIGYFAGMAIILVRLLHRRTMLRLSARLMRPDSLLVRRLLRVSLPGGLDILSLIACQLWFVQIINALGNLPAAAHGIALRVESISFMPGAAFQIAAATMVGQALGAGSSRRASHAVGVAIRTTVVLMCAIGVFLYVGADWLASFFVRDDQSGIALEAAGLVRIVSFAQLPLAVLMVLTGALRGAGDTRGPLAITFIGFLAVRIPLAVILAWSAITLPGSGDQLELFNLGVRGAWYAMAIDLYVRTGLAVARFRHGVWKRIEV
jgi:putative MATE family efflux protein